MKRTVTFGDNEQDRDRFGMVFTAFIAGGNAILGQRQGQRSRDDRAKDASLLRKLKAIAEKTRDEYRLQAGGGTLVLDQKEHDHLMGYLQAAPIATQDSDRLDDAIDFVAAAATKPPETQAI